MIVLKRTCGLFSRKSVRSRERKPRRRGKRLWSLIKSVRRYDEIKNCDDFSYCSINPRAFIKLIIVDRYLSILSMSFTSKYIFRRPASVYSKKGCAFTRLASIWEEDWICFVAPVVIVEYIPTEYSNSWLCAKWEKTRAFSRTEVRSGKQSTKARMSSFTWFNIVVNFAFCADLLDDDSSLSASAKVKHELEAKTED